MLFVCVVEKREEHKSVILFSDISYVCYFLFSLFSLSLSLSLSLSFFLSFRGYDNLVDFRFWYRSASEGFAREESCRPGS